MNPNICAKCGERRYSVQMRDADYGEIALCDDCHWDGLPEAEKERRIERASNAFEAWDGGFAENH